MSATTTGEVFTQRWVVELMLNMVDYCGPVETKRVVEPSIGAGAFVGPIVERLAQTNAPFETLANAFRGYDFRAEHVTTSKKVARTILINHGYDSSTADQLADAWLHKRDFLLAEDLVDNVDLVIGNPPYIRADNIEPSLLNAYRHVCKTMTRRADIFVGFFERGLDILAPNGQLIYICADRWMRNGYGKDLRAKVIRDYSVDDVIVLHDADTFDNTVSAYPAIVSLSKKPQGSVNVVSTTATFNSEAAKTLISWRSGNSPTLHTVEQQASTLETWHTTDDVWPDGPPEVQSWLARISELPQIEDTGIRLGIGIATGADKIFIRKAADVEAERLVPMVTPGGIKGPQFRWSGEHLVSPWQGRSLVTVDEFPKLQAYYQSHYDKLSGRNVAKRSHHWWRTIDSFNPDLMKQDLLVMQDLKRHAHPVRVPAGYYPHHGLTWFASHSWDLDVLGGLLLSAQVEQQVASYCVRMRGGTLRFQPTVMRKVRLPHFQDIHQSIAAKLAKAFTDFDRAAASAAAAALFPEL